MHIGSTLYNSARPWPSRVKAASQAGSTLYPNFPQITHNSADHATLTEVEYSGMRSLCWRTWSSHYKTQNTELLERLTALETTVASITESTKGLDSIVKHLWLLQNNLDWGVIGWIFVLFLPVVADGLDTLRVEVRVHDSEIEELNSNDAVQNERIIALEATVNGNHNIPVIS